MLNKVFIQLCGTLKGWNYEYSNNEGRFDFYLSEKAIGTMVCRNGEIKLADDIEYYETESTYNNLTLKEYCRVTK